MSKKLPTFWYVEPLDGHTNEAFRLYLSAQRACEDTGETSRSGGGEFRKWRCTYGDIKHLRDSMAEFALKFREYNQRDPNGRIRLWTFGRRKFRRSLSEVKKFLSQSR